MRYECLECRELFPEESIIMNHQNDMNLQLTCHKCWKELYED